MTTRRQSDDPSNHREWTSLDYYGAAQDEDSESNWLAAGGGAAITSGKPKHTKRRKNKGFQMISLVAFLFSWVANGEMLQGITNGSIGIKPYEKPVFITWFSYNFMTLGLVSVIPYIRNRNWTLRHYVGLWAGKLGALQCIIACTIISYLLQLLNILMIMGLECVSVSLSNGIYQLQTVFTIGLSVGLLKDKFLPQEAIGIGVASIGVLCIVVPPILNDDANSLVDDGSPCAWKDAPELAGTLVTIGSAAIGGAYLISWRVFDESRYSTRLDPLEGLMDTQMSLAMIGLCNFVFGWPLLYLANGLAWEILEWPSSFEFHILVANALVEYLFDACCASAIYMTSPIIVAVVSPLTIPLSLLADQYLYPAAATNSSPSWIGSVIIIIGVYILEAKPKLIHPCRRTSNMKTEERRELSSL